MKLLRVGLALLASYLLFGAVPVHALDTVPSVVKPDSPVIITGYSATSARLNYVQLFNSGSTPIDISGWKVEYSIKDQTAAIPLVTLNGLLKPLNYIVAADSLAVSSPDFPYVLEIPSEIISEATSIRLVSPQYADVTATLKYTTGACKDVTTEDYYWQRNVSESTGKYTTTFDCFVPSDSYKLLAHGLYEYPGSVGLQVSEILPNPRNCSPLDKSAACGDYVKFYNPTNQTVDLSKLRLRLGYQGQGATASNTYLLGGKIPAGHYKTITSDVDGRPLSITNGGGFVWLEDTYGIKRYDNTVQEYADASLESKKGYAWAYDENDGAWKWTTQPTPQDAPSVFVAPPPKKVKLPAVKSYVPCKAGQYRSKETNRCRSLASDVANSLTPCKPGQERNPETNRCRKIGSGASTLVPCKATQERNPETNRCRNKTSAIPDAAFAVAPIKETGKAFAGWWALGGVGVLAVGYGAWEWRSEVANGVRRAVAFVTGHK